MDPRLANYVTKDPDRLGGVPVFTGTRVPVRSLFDYLKAGRSTEQFLADFPGVSSEQILAVLDLAIRDVLKDLQAA